MTEKWRLRSYLPVPRRPNEGGSEIKKQRLGSEEIQRGKNGGWKHTVLTGFQGGKMKQELEAEKRCIKGFWNLLDTTQKVCNKNDEMTHPLFSSWNLIGRLTPTSSRPFSAAFWLAEYIL
jgi:hypothetical protein